MKPEFQSPLLLTPILTSPAYSSPLAPQDLSLLILSSLSPTHDIETCVSLYVHLDSRGLGTKIHLLYRELCEICQNQGMCQIYSVNPLSKHLCKE